MELFRRAARGRLAELPALGASFLPMDIDARRDASTLTELGGVRSTSEDCADYGPAAIRDFDPVSGAT